MGRSTSCCSCRACSVQSSPSARFPTSHGQSSRFSAQSRRAAGLLLRCPHRLASSCSLPTAIVVGCGVGRTGQRQKRRREPPRSARRRILRVATARCDFLLWGGAVQSWRMVRCPQCGANVAESRVAQHSCFHRHPGVAQSGPKKSTQMQVISAPRRKRNLQRKQNWSVPAETPSGQEWFESSFVQGGLCNGDGT